MTSDARCLEGNKMADVRWLATVVYLRAVGAVAVTYPLTEVSDLDGLIEHGPDWRSIVAISIVPDPGYVLGHPRITVEQSLGE